MAISLSIYSNTYSTTKTVNVDFVTSVLALQDDVSVDPDTRYFFKLTTSARDTSNAAYIPRVVIALSDLALNKTKQSSVNTSAPYADIKSMVLDYVFDYMNGHLDNQFSSGVTARPPMKFTS